MKQLAKRIRGLSRLQGDEAGVTMILWVLLIVGMLIIVAIVIDLGNARQEKRQLQNAADAAALAGASEINKVGGTPCTTAVTYTFNNMRLGTVQGACTGSGTQTYSQSVGNSSVNVLTPYTLTGSTFPAAQLINVKACKDVATTFARIINVTSVHVCGNATARKIGGTPPAPGPSPSDAETPCTVDAFTTNGYFSDDGNEHLQGNPDTGGGKPNYDNPGMKAVSDNNHSGGAPGGSSGEGKWMGATYYSTTDIDLTINPPKFTLTNTTTGSVAATTTYTAGTGAGLIYIKPMTSIRGVAVPPGTFAYDIAWKVPSLGGSGDNAAYTVSMVVNDSASASFPPLGKCGKTQWQYVRGHPAASGTSTCGEDSFLGAIWVVDGTTGAKTSGIGATAKPGDYVGATYQDESAIFNVLDSSDPAYENRIKFADNGTLIPEDTLGTPTTKGPNTVHQPFVAGTPTDKFTLTSGTTLLTTNEKYSTDILWKLPATIANGTHTITLKGYDGDNNKTGGDCGVGTWTINVAGGASDVMLVQ